MFFCQHCGAILTESTDGIAHCSCGHTQELSGTIVEKGERTTVPDPVDRQVDPIAAFDHICPKCGFGKARLYSKGTMVTDEDEHMAYVCGKCGHHDRCEGLKIT